MDNSSDLGDYRQFVRTVESSLPDCDANLTIDAVEGYLKFYERISGTFLDIMPLLFDDTESEATWQLLPEYVSMYPQAAHLFKYTVDSRGYQGGASASITVTCSTVHVHSTATLLYVRHAQSYTRRMKIYNELRQSLTTYGGAFQALPVNINAIWCDGVMCLKRRQAKHQVRHDVGYTGDHSTHCAGDNRQHGACVRTTGANDRRCCYCHRRHL